MIRLKSFCAASGHCGFWMQGMMSLKVIPIYKLQW